LTHHSRSRDMRRAAGAVAIVVSLAAGTFAGWACGPFFPNWILGSDRSFLGAPGGVLRFEVQRLKLPVDPFHGQTASDPYRETADADTADLVKVLAKSDLAAERRTALLAEHAALRKLLSEHATGVAAAARVAAHPDERSQEATPSPPTALAPATAVPAGLPGEFADYLQGAVAFHQGRLPEANAAWQRLLRRPAAERRLRSTWAAFMLGKTSLKGDRKEAARWFQTTRELAAHGFEDSLGLAAASLGWEARAERDLGHVDRALALYARQVRSGDPLALSSLQFLCRQALKKGADALNPIARSADARDVMTAFLVSDRHAPWADQEASQVSDVNPAVDPDIAAWLKAVKAAGIKEASGAERLAWIAYQGGDFATARDWAQRAPADAPMARWIRAKLLLRDGKLGEAQKLLDEVARTLPSPDKDDLQQYDPNQGWGKVATPALAHGEDGALLLSLGQYAPALDHFLRGGFWLEAAYVADRVLTVEELQKYVDTIAPSGTGPEQPEASIGFSIAGVEAPDVDKLGRALRYLLGRRLVRAGRYADARPYLPANLRATVDVLGKALREGRDAARPADQRARSLFQAACITRKQGMELAGTESFPDWMALDGGNFELPAFSKHIAKRADNTILVPGADEQQRAGRHRAEPEKRFHYRYQAAALAGDAAALLPDGSEDKARMLATAGSWLNNRDPEAAQPYLKALLLCCGTTRLGKAARLHHLPEVPDCDMGVPGAPRP